MDQQRSEPRLGEWLHMRGSKLGLPVGGNFELTARCNFRCPMCYIHTSQANQDAAERELSAAQWIDLAQQACDRGMMFALLTGGEPFLRKDFFEIYEAMRRMGLLVSINSNGSLLSGETLERLLANPPVRMNISLYGGSRETYRNMCGRDMFDQVVENIRALRRAGVSVRLNVSITPHNRQDMAAIYEISRELDVSAKAASYMFPPARTCDGRNDCASRLSEWDSALCALEWDRLRFPPEVFEQRLKSIRDLTLLEEEECALDTEEGITCRAGVTTFWLTWDGRMLPCGMMPVEGVRPLELGFDEAWQQIRRQAGEIRMPAACGSCAKRGICGVCAASCIAETGEFSGVPEYICRKADATLQICREMLQKGNGR